MNVLYLILPISFVLAAGIIYAFVRATLSGQWDDLDTPAYRILFDDTDQPKGDSDVK